MFNAIGRVSAEQTIDQSIADADVRCAFEMINSECTKGKASRSALPSIFAACCTSDEYNIACCTSDECSVCPETFSSDQQQKRRQGLGHVDAHTGVTCATGLRCGCVCVSAQPTSAIPSHSPLECDRIGTRCAADAVGSAKCDDTREREAVRGGGRRAAQHACDGCAWNGCSVRRTSSTAAVARTLALHAARCTVESTVDRWSAAMRCSAVQCGASMPSPAVGRATPGLGPQVAANQR